MPAGGDDLRALAVKIDRMVAEIDGRQAFTKLLAAAKYAEEYGARPMLASDTGGDGRMSNWWRLGSGRKGNRSPIPIVNVVRSVGFFQVSVEPAARSRGPWRVLEEGRKANKPGVTYNKGYIKPRRDGSPGYAPKHLDLGGGQRLYRRRNKGASRSRPKHTWTKSVAAMHPLANHAVRVRVDEAFVRVWSRATAKVGPPRGNYRT